MGNGPHSSCSMLNSTLSLNQISAALSLNCVIQLSWPSDDKGISGNFTHGLESISAGILKLYSNLVPDFPDQIGDMTNKNQEEYC